MLIACYQVSSLWVATAIGVNGMYSATGWDKYEAMWELAKFMP